MTLMVGISIASSNASAQEIYDWADTEVPAVVSSQGNLVFIGKEKAPTRVYSWKAAKGKHKKNAYLVDMDGDGKADVVGAGKPMFVLSSASDPVAFHKKGCFQVLVADFTADNKNDIACINGGSIAVFTHDLQMAWTSKINKKFSFCRAGDVNGDLKADLECKAGKLWSRFDGSTGELLAASTDTEEVTSPLNPGIGSADASVLDGKMMFDFNADGTAEESLLKDGNAVAIRSRSLKKGLGRIELKSAPISALVKDLDGDKKLDIIIVTKNQIVIASTDGKSKSYSLNAKKYKRSPIAKLDSVYANGFESQNENAQKVVSAVNAKLSKCYASQVRKNQFAGVGKMLVEATVNKKGKVTHVTEHHSSLADKKVGKCVRAIAKKLKFPEAATDAASINISMTFTFRDN